MYLFFLAKHAFEQAVDFPEVWETKTLLWHHSNQVNPISIRIGLCVNNAMRLD